ncbi:MAG: endonuclease [Thermoplasmata archaeon M9B1D]|nr:MAG: endonuclease [Thermoplasmata archaeon M9B1D]PNX51311.1 MAG: endonuclease [Thermoplasmata archaeon M8B2D]
MKLSPLKLYQILTKKVGNLNWWPVDKKYHEKNSTDPRFEIIVGAVLTQNTAWSNVEKALLNLKSQKMLNLEKLANEDIKKLTKLIRPSGFFNQKAIRLKNISIYLKNKYNSNLDRFFIRDMNVIRKELLSLNGIGPETADSILLYAGNKPIFVVDAYTKRLCERIPIDTNISYNEIQKYFQKELAEKYQGEELIKAYKNLHAQIVIFAKKYCKKKPICKNCPIFKHCNFKEKSF